MTTEEKRGKKAFSSFRPTWRLTRVLNPRRFSYLLLFEVSQYQKVDNIYLTCKPVTTEQSR